MTIEDYLTKTCLFLGVDEEELQLEKEDGPDKIRVNLLLPAEKATQFTGLNSERIRALEYLTKIVFREELGDKRFFLDVNNYQKQKEEKLAARAKKLAHQVLATGEEEVLKNLNSYERYLVHSAIAEDEELTAVTTKSKTVGTERWLTISLA